MGNWDGSIAFCIICDIFDTICPKGCHDSVLVPSIAEKRGRTKNVFVGLKLKIAILIFMDLNFRVVFVFGFERKVLLLYHFNRIMSAIKGFAATTKQTNKQTKK